MWKARTTTTTSRNIGHGHVWFGRFTHVRRVFFLSEWNVNMRFVFRYSDVCYRSVYASSHSKCVIKLLNVKCLCLTSPAFRNVDGRRHGFHFHPKHSVHIVPDETTQNSCVYSSKPIHIHSHPFQIHAISRSTVCYFVRTFDYM